MTFEKTPKKDKFFEFEHKNAYLTRIKPCFIRIYHPTMNESFFGDFSRGGHNGPPPSLTWQKTPDAGRVKTFSHSSVSCNI